MPFLNINSSLFLMQIRTDDLLMAHHSLSQNQRTQSQIHSQLSWWCLRVRLMFYRYHLTLELMPRNIELGVLVIEETLFHSKHKWMCLLSVPEELICPPRGEPRGFCNKEMIADIDETNESNQESDEFVLNVHFWVKDLFHFSFSMKRVFCQKMLVFPRLF